MLWDDRLVCGVFFLRVYVGGFVFELFIEWFCLIVCMVYGVVRCVVWEVCLEVGVRK